MRIRSILPLSLVAIIVLHASASANSYVPLTSSGADFSWTMFGVNGFITPNSSSSVDSTSLDFTNPTFTIEDADPDDELAVSGFPDVSAKNMASIKALKGMATIEVSLRDLSSSDLKFEPTEAVRSMYIKTGNSVGALFTYKASLEDAVLEYQISGDNEKTYVITISAKNTFDNPAEGVLKASLEDVTTTTNPESLFNLSDVFDYNLQNNPYNSNDYTTAAYQESVTGYSLRMYSYNSALQLWEIYDSDNAAGTNDFERLYRGKAYWAKVDTDTGRDTTNPDKKVSGMVLGSSGLTDADYLENGGLNPGWNLISFDDAKPIIKTSNTGLIVGYSAANGSITLIDSSGENSVTIALAATDTAVTAARKINTAIEAEKLTGSIPDTFDLKVFPVSVSSLMMLSDKKFTLQDTGNANITTATTLTGGNVWDVGALDYANFSAGNVNATGVSSVYGEYALIFKPLYGAGTASGTATSAIQVNDNNAISTTSAANVAAIATAMTFTGSEDAVAYKGTALDSNYDGTADHVLIAAPSAFFLRDHTFTRVFTYDNTNQTVNDTIEVGDTPITILNASNTIGTVVSTINTALSDIDAQASGSDLVLIASSKDRRDFDAKDSETSEFLTDDYSFTGTVGKGAVEGVYKLNTLVNAIVNLHSFEIDIDDAPDNAADSVRFVITHADSSTTATATLTGAITQDDGTAYYDMFNSYTTALQDSLNTLGYHTTVYHDYDQSNTDPALALDAAKIYIVGDGDISSITVDYTDGGNGVESDIAGITDANSATYGTLTLPNADYADLRYNARYSPDFPIEGPLYTLKGLGYNPLAILTSETKFSTGNISWDNLDLTVDPVDWMKDQNHNLFAIDGKAGYWAYLETDTGSNSLAVSNVEVSENLYKHHFDYTTDTTTNIVHGNLNVTISGLSQRAQDAGSATVFANVDGNRIELLDNGVNDGQYSGVISTFELPNLKPKTVGSDDSAIVVLIYDGLGYEYVSEGAGTFDYSKPALPVTSLKTGIDIALTSTSSDVGGYYIYKDVVAETDLDNYLTYVPAASAGSFNLCGAVSTFEYDTDYTLKIFAVDGTGLLYNGNASDIETKVFAPTLKSAHLLSNTADGTGKVADLPAIYDATCNNTGTATVNSGIALKTITADHTVKIAFQPIEGLSFDSDIPYTIYIKGGTNKDVVAEIKYHREYANSGEMYIDIDGVLYRMTFPVDDTTNGTSDNPIKLDDLGYKINSSFNDQHL